MSAEDGTDSVAVIGLACRFPGAPDAATFWANLAGGVESIRFFDEEELRRAGVPEAELRDPAYVRAAPVLEDHDCFDAGFFGVSPKEARAMDPQHRLLLEVCWTALEDAGIDPRRAGHTGVFAGAGGVVTSWLAAHLPELPSLLGPTGSMEHLGNDKDFIATRVAYKLDLTGPAIDVQTACSTALVATHLACRSLLDGECDMALAGASTVRYPHEVGYRMQKGDILSPDGHCRAFDAEAQGTIFGSGCGVLLLKRTADALRDGDPIRAVIRATAVNNDGAAKVSYTASSVEGQARAMATALALSEVPVDSIGYVECHGTGTAMGDPLEIQALTRAFRRFTDQRGFCAVGSVKTNVGHLEQTAAAAGLIKAVLALEHGTIPPSLNFRTPNPKIDFGSSPFFVAAEPTAWPVRGEPRRAAVNALGLGGTNAFAVLEQAPDRDEAGRTVRVQADRGVQHLALSAPDEEGLRRAAARQAEGLEGRHPSELLDLGHTLSRSRSRLAERLVVLASDPREAADRLRRASAGQGGRGIVMDRARTRPLVMLFPGQGAQAPGMTAALCADPVYASALESVRDAMEPHLDGDLLEVLFGGDAGLIHRTRWTQPALFAVEYALAQLWASWGVVPDYVMGHSVGEITAACVSGALTLEDAARLVAGRGALMDALPEGGAMAAVRADEDRVRALIEGLDGRVEVAAVNGADAVTVSGDEEAVEGFLLAAELRDIRGRRLTVSHAFHSARMDPILDPLTALCRELRWKRPKIPLVDNLTGEIRKRRHAPDYWARHARGAVRFADGLRTLADAGVELFLEVGPGSALTGFAAGMPDGQDRRFVSTLRRGTPDWPAALTAAARVHACGRDVDWDAVDRPWPRRRVSAPGYPFARERWVPRAGRAVPAGGHPLLGRRLRSSLAAAHYDAEWSLEQLPWLRDHRIFGLAVLPTTAVLEAATSAVAEGATLENLVYQEALIVPEEGARAVQLVVEDAGPAAGFRVRSADADDPASWRTHATGRIVSAAGPPPGPIDLQATAAALPEELDPERYYRAIAALGLGYGPSFRAIRSLRRGEDRVLARVILSAAVDHGEFGLHPALLDASLHVYPLLAPDLPDLEAVADPEHTWLPIGVARYRLHRRGVREGWARGVRRRFEDGTLVVDIDLFDDEGRPAASIEGLSLRRLAVDDLRPSEVRSARRTLHHLRWDPGSPAALPVGAAEGRWLLIGGGDTGARLEGALSERGAEVVRIPGRGPELQQALLTALTPETRRIVDLRALELPALEPLDVAGLIEAERQAAEPLLDLLRTFFEARPERAPAARFWLVTRNAQAADADPAPTDALQGLLWGIGRSASLEAPTAWGGMLDLAPRGTAEPGREAELLARELLFASDDEQRALRGEDRRVARFVRVPDDLPLARGPLFRSDASYLVTGGLGTLGRLCVRWMAERGAGRVVVTTRGAPERGADLVREALEAGCELRVLQVDASDEAEVAALVAGPHFADRPLAGVFHCAGRLDDAVLANQDWGRFSSVTAPKVRGAWALHRATRGLALDHFVLFSSVLGVLGSAGQANYAAGNTFLDALASARRAEGLPAVSLQWGPWEGEGLATESGERGRAIWRARGTRYLPPELGLRAFEEALRLDLESVSVTLTDWSVFVRQFLDLPGSYSILAREAGAARGGGDLRALAARLPSTRGPARTALLLELVQRQVSDALELDEPIPLDRPITDFGLDSLMSVSLVNSLEGLLGVAVPVVKLIQGPSVRELVTELFGGEPTEPVSPEAAGPSASAPGWLAFLRPLPEASRRLICFPFAGGGSAAFRSWATALAPQVEVVVVEAPGRLGRIREEPVRSLDAWMQGLLPELLPILPEKPYAFFGHCLGGLTMFETARLLHEHRLPLPERIFASGARPPNRVDRIGPFEMELLRDLLAMPEYDAERPLWEQPDAVFGEAVLRFDIADTAEMLADEELRALILPTVRAEFELASRYRYPGALALPVPITCFSGRDDAYVTRVDAMDWARCTDDSFELLLRPGAHFLMKTDRDFLLRTIRRRLSPA